MNVVLMSQDVVGPNMAGPGIRYWELAHTLSDEFTVTLLAREGSAAPASAVKLLCYQWGDAAALRSAADQADVVVINSFLLGTHPELSATSTPMVVDLYDPLPIENLVHAADQDADSQARSFAENQTWLRQGLVRGDFFVCATPRQRDLWIGTLLAHGRINPATLAADPLLRQLITLLPSGLPATPPTPGPAVLKGVWPGIAADDQVILWSGGLWDWLDPLTVIQAMPLVIAAQPRAKLVFLGRGHPTPGVADAMQMPQRAQQLAAHLGLLDQSVFFNAEWVPYASRGHYLIEADVAISLHEHSLESEFAAVRSRVLDHLWAGLPSVLTTGDPASLWLEPLGAALSVPPGDAAAVAAALVKVLSNPAEQSAMAAAARQAAASVTWPQVSTELRAFCHQPQRAADAGLEVAPVPSSPPDPAPAPTADLPAPPVAESPTPALNEMSERLLQLVHDDNAARQAAMQRLEQLWNQPKSDGLWGRVRRWLGGEQPHQAQLEFNATLIQSLYAVNERADQERSLVIAIANHLQTAESIQPLVQRHERAEAHLRAISASLDQLSGTLHARIDATDRQLAVFPADLAARLLLVEEHLRGMSVQVRDHLQRLDGANADLNDRLLRAEDHLREIEPRLRTVIEQTQLAQRDLGSIEESLTALASTLTSLRLSALPQESAL